MSNIFFKISNSSSAFMKLVSNHGIKYPTPISLNYAYSFGSLAGVYFVIQVITGILLAMHYVPHTNYAFDSVIYIMQEVNNGWLIRYMHMNGASMIFIFLYCHIGRGLYYQSYLYNKSTLWYSGIIIFLLMMATAFIGYVLPWGQMSLWGATVITNFVTAIPYIGEKLVHWIWGGYSVSGATLTRFYSLHYLLPFIIFALIFSHLVLLHQVGSTNPSQISTSSKVSFHPYFTYKDLFAFNVSLILFVLLVFFNPNLLGHPDNYIKANSLITPAHIVPEWYFTPFYAILRTCSSKLGGVISMLLAILILFALPLQGYIKSSIQVNTEHSFVQQMLFWVFAATFLLLIYLGGKPAIAPYVTLSRIYTAFYFSYMLIIIGNLVGNIEYLMTNRFHSNFFDTRNSKKLSLLSSFNKHTFHVLPINALPFLISNFIATFLMTQIFWWHSTYNFYGANLLKFYSQFSFFNIFIVTIIWAYIILKESTEGSHVFEVKKGLEMGFWLFLITEIMLFVSFFWAWFYLSCNPSIATGALWPSLEILRLPIVSLPLYNTLILLFSAYTLTLAHRVILKSGFNYAVFVKKNFSIYLILTIFLGIIFLISQYFEYKYALPSTWSQTSFWSCLYLLTGFHGFHVLIGTLLLLFTLMRTFLFNTLLNSNYLGNIAGNLNYYLSFSQHLGFEVALYYWHFVDFVWLFLWIFVYLWAY